MIYLWEDGAWKSFESTDADALKRHNIAIGDGATIGDRAAIGDGASIGKGIVPLIIYIIGSRFTVSYWGEDRIDIGCTPKRINEWLNDGERIAKAHEFTPEQVKEYIGYVEFIKAQYEASPALDESIKTEETEFQEE